MKIVKIVRSYRCFHGPRGGGCSHQPDERDEVKVGDEDARQRGLLRLLLQRPLTLTPHLHRRDSEDQHTPHSHRGDTHGHIRAQAAGGVTSDRSEVLPTDGAAWTPPLRVEYRVPV